MWAKICDRLHAHSKARRAREAMALWVLALSWCASELTDGVVPADMPELLIPGGDSYAERLVSVGLWERVEGGFRFHDWAEYQPSGEEMRTRRAAISKARSESGKRGAAKRWQTDGKAHGKPMANAWQSTWQTDSPVPVPVPIEDSLRSSSAREASPSLDDAPTASPPLALVTTEQSSAKGAGAPDRPRRRAKPHPVEDRAPEDGTEAARAYEVITRDDLLRPITAAPGEFARRVTDGAYPGVDVVAEIKRAAEWLDSKRGTPQGAKSDGRAFLRNWLQGKADRIAAMPKPASAPQDPRRADHRPAVVLDGGAKLLEGPSVAEQWANLGKAVKR